MTHALASAPEPSSSFTTAACPPPPRTRGHERCDAIHALVVGVSLVAQQQLGHLQMALARRQSGDTPGGGGGARDDDGSSRNEEIGDECACAGV